MALPILGILSAVVEPISSFIKNWQTRRTVKLESDVRIAEAQVNAKIRRLETAQDADIAWENLSIDRSGWKDEYWTIVLSIPAILSFIPGASDFVMRGFDALSRTPDWYQWMLGIAIASAFGYRKIADFMSLKKGAK